jgi:steroid delta-isomerase-like uncharacterized protein
MGIEENKGLARRLVEELLNQRKLDVVDEIFAEDFVDHQGGLGPTGDRDSVRAFARALTDGFPDAHYELINLIAEGDRVLLHIKTDGTHSAEFRGVPATGRKVTNAGMSVIRVAGGKVVERWNVTDFAALMQQISA